MPGLPVIVFDVNETLLDLESLTPTFERILGDRLALRRWFAELILYSEALTLAGIYVPFTDIGGAVLNMVATTAGISISAADRAELTEKFASMPAHPEVLDALAKLKRAGFRLCTLTNNTAEISGRQLKQAGLLDAFERRFSVDDVRRHKPAPEVYASVARALQTKPAEMCLVACHTWDTLGAVAAGWEAALVLRPGNALLDVGPQPQMTGMDLADVADKLIARTPTRIAWCERNRPAVAAEPGWSPPTRCRSPA
jgi:2-haloacid dehalogenase